MIKPETIINEIENFLAKNNLNSTAIDAVILGKNGDNRYDYFYKNLQRKLLKNKPQLAYKHLVGDFDTASGYAVFVAAKILKTSKIPAILKLNNVDCKIPKHILIYNQYLGRDHSLMLLSAV